MDILQHDDDDHRLVGFLAETADEYANRMLQIIEMNERERDTIRSTARAAIERFDQRVFATNWNRALLPLIE